MEEQFKTKENGFEEIRKKMILRTIPILLIAGLGGLAMSYFNTDEQASDINTLPFVIPIVLGAMAYGLFKGIKRQKDIFNSYILTINKEKIIRQQNLTPDIVIPIHEIKKIIKNKDGSLGIIGADPQNAIGIPIQVERMDELELMLSEISEITTSYKKSFIQKFPWVLPLLTIGLMITVYLSENKIFVGIAGVSLTSVLIYSLYTTQKSKHVDHKTKKSMWLVLLVIVAVITITIVKVLGSN